MSTVKALSKIFKSIDTEASRLETIAGGIIGIVRQSSVNTLADFDALVRAAYEDAGWNITAGRPREGSTATAVPGSVRSYVSDFRAAFRLGLPVTTYTSMRQLRQAIKTERQERAGGFASNLDETKKPEFQGVRVSDDTALNGSLFHDLAVVFLALPEEQEEAMSAALEKLMRKYLKSVEKELEDKTRKEAA